MPKCGANFRKPVEYISDRAKRYRAHSPGCRPKGPKVCFQCGSRRNVVPDHKDSDESNGRRSNLRWACKSHNTILGKKMAREGRGVRTRQYNPGHNPYRYIEAYGSGYSSKPRSGKYALWEKPETGGRARRVGTAQNQEEAYAFLEGAPIRKKRIVLPAQRSLFGLGKNPGGATNLAQYVQAAMDHVRGSHDAAGAILHATPKSKRREFAKEIWFRRGYRGPNPRKKSLAKQIDSLIGATPVPANHSDFFADLEDRLLGAQPSMYKHHATRKPSFIAKNPERAESNKLTHAAVKYENPSLHYQYRVHQFQSCASCAHFIAASPPRCESVQNPISPGAWCKRFKKRGKNPSEADDLYRKFHGRGPDKILTLQRKGMDPYGGHPELTSLGPLIRLVVGEGVEMNEDGTVKEEGEFCNEINFVPMAEYRRRIERLNTKDPEQVRAFKAWLKQAGAPDVAAVPNTRQLYFVGGKQSLTDSELLALGCDPEKDLSDLGYAYLIEYVAQKRFDNFEVMTYYHAFGEVSGIQPRLTFRRHPSMFELMGGEYLVRSVGIDN
jgi:hypothetical protein